MSCSESGKAAPSSAAISSAPRSSPGRTRGKFGTGISERDIVSAFKHQTTSISICHRPLAILRAMLRREAFMPKMTFGITLSNRGTLLGLCTAGDLLTLADAAERVPQIDSIWCGDALFVNRRLDALTLLAAVAGRTQRVLLGPACMGSFALRDPLVFAYEWASLDVISNGRTRLVACAGGGAGPLWEAETTATRIAPQERRKRMVE